MKRILSLNTDPDRDFHNLREFIPPYGSSNIVFDTEEELLEHIIQRNIEEGLIAPDADVYIVDKADFPPEWDYFFDAGEWQNGPAINMPKARTIQMAHIRKARDAGLAKLDVPYLKALEAGDTVEQQRIADLKQGLRDVPQTCDLEQYTTPWALKTAWPEELP